MVALYGHRFPGALLQGHALPDIFRISLVGDNSPVGNTQSTLARIENEKEQERCGHGSHYPKAYLEGTTTLAHALTAHEAIQLSLHIGCRVSLAEQVVSHGYLLPAKSFMS